jgi:hypothetical protein
MAGRSGSTQSRNAFRWLALLLAFLIGVAVVDRVGLLPGDLRQAARNAERELFGTDYLHDILREPGRDSITPRRDDAQPIPDLDYAALRVGLDSIRVEPERRRGYQREDWPHWRESKGCINVREEVLIRDSLDPAKLSADGCAVESGLWRDPYTGQVLRDPKLIDIDHMVALEEAFQSGGYDWDRDRRASYANDLSDRRTLLAVSREANRAKGSKGPEEWLPPDISYRCRYIADWISVKARWALTMDESERVAVGNILADCEDQRVAGGGN